MNMKRLSIMCIISLSVAVTGFAQGRGQGRGPAGGPPSINSGRSADHTQVDHGQGRRSEENRGPKTASETDHARRNDVSTRLSKNPQMASKLQALLPAGTNVETAAAGFKNFGQFVAAVHVSKNLGIPFDQLKTEMVTNDKSLGGAIHQLKPDLDDSAVKTETKRAETEAKTDTKK
jgi:hypothetical protein